MRVEAVETVLIEEEVWDRTSSGSRTLRRILRQFGRSPLGLKEAVPCWSLAIGACYPGVVACAVLAYVMAFRLVAG